ncbi:MAG: hypothetical protein ACE5LB_06140 [Acidiferrobacterales bacterium]
MKRVLIMAGFMYALVLTSVQAQDRVELPGATIIGNRELPKVLYIVPWKKPNADNLMGNPVASLLHEALSHVDRDVFRRQVEYYDDMTSGKTTTPASSK